LPVRRSLATYVIALVASAAVAALLLSWGNALYPGATNLARGGLDPAVLERLQHPLPLLLLQIVVILAVARLCGAAIRKAGQPAVIGEILGGILLGPSLLGWVAPPALAFLFPPASLPALGLLSQVGVLLFMFAVGLEVDLGEQAHRARTAIAVSHGGIVVPFLLGIGVALAGFEALARPGVGFVAFALFFGISLSVTAFPVLARILQERGLSRTALGQNALACAAIGDVLAWCLLALVVAIVKARGFADAALTVGLTAVFAAVMIGGVRRPLERIVERQFHPGGENRPLIAGMLIFAFGSATLTELIGIHALFGAFLAGALVSGRREFRAWLHDRVQPLSALILLPLFFALVGLRTKLGLLDSVADWVLCGGIIVVAIAGKLGGVMLAARWAGSDWREAFALGTLMNTRGLMELIVLNIGYDLGILSARVFTMLVLMALVTTVMTGPLLSLALKQKKPGSNSNF
jgi:Kef-type K+ transport system membrane component KefB